MYFLSCNIAGGIAEGKKHKAGGNDSEEGKSNGIHFYFQLRIYLFIKWEGMNFMIILLKICLYL